MLLMFVDVYWSLLMFTDIYWCWLMFVGCILGGRLDKIWKNLWSLCLCPLMPPWINGLILIVTRLQAWWAWNQVRWCQEARDPGGCWAGRLFWGSTCSRWSLKHVCHHSRCGILICWAVCWRLSRRVLLEHGVCLVLVAKLRENHRLAVYRRQMQDNVGWQQVKILQNIRMHLGHLCMS